jgi:hypothetical protein
MKKLTKLLALVLVVLMAATLFTACENKTEKMAQLSGSWLYVGTDSEEQVLALLQNVDMYEEEIAVADTSSLKFAWVYTFDMEGNFRQYEDVERDKQFVREFYKGFFADLYENRDALVGSYEEDLSAMTEGEMQLFYAGLYGYETFDDMINDFADIAYNYDEWEDIRNGTFEIDDGKLNIVDQGDEYYVDYVIEGDTLTITYKDGVEVYTKIN